VLGSQEPPPLTSLAALHYSDSNGFSLALTSSRTVAGALQIKRDPYLIQELAQCI
jgi:hypothetical protein